MQVAVVSVLAKALCGGALVLTFAALSEALKPKRFAGILGAAPSVAIAGIVVGSLAKGPLDQAAAARTMIAGAVALTDELRAAATADQTPTRYWFTQLPAPGTRRSGLAGREVRVPSTPAVVT